MGATIPGGYTIKRSKLRGEYSDGMLCSEEELGIGEDTTGIMILPPDFPLGADLADVLDLKDTVFDIGITPNRSDCLSIIGVAREIAAVTGKTVRLPEIGFQENDEDIQRHASVQILDPDLCPRYTARMVRNVTVGPSPLWMRLRLEAVGLRSISNVVDVTNFVMMELGQPLHAFDFRFLEESRIVVRRSAQGEPFISLDEKERILNANTLMICDGVKPVAIAGIMGGFNSEIKPDTQDILLESAYFTPSSIRRSARDLGMSTDAAFRFERGIDPEGVLRALDRAAQLTAQLSGGTVCRGRIDEHPRPVETAREIPLRCRRVNSLLGTDIPAADMVDILKNLGMEVLRQEGGEEEYLINPPSFRVDIAREIDLVEEIARIHGYHNVPVTLPLGRMAPVRQNEKRVLEERMRNHLTSHGISEVITYSFISPDAADILALDIVDERRKGVRISNPLTEDQSVMRTTLIYSLLKVMRENANAGDYNLKIFEFGKVFLAGKPGELPTEKKRLACLMTGMRDNELWSSGESGMDFYDLKGCVESLTDSLRITGVRFRSDAVETFFHPGRACGIFLGEGSIGYMGEVHPDVLTRMDLKNRALVFELDMDALSEHISEGVAYREFSRYPESSRDVAFVIDSNVEVGAILDIALSTGEDLLERVRIFDVYAGAGIPEGKKSLGLRFTYRSYAATLTDDAVNRVHSKIVHHIIDRTGAQIR
ncbi:MAG: Phenylalanine--tRNA ligase beta subunit [Syntrophus sp. PtaU1.Bin208]|nr:MAG: Phenylalanine--tRNA ligase beta subunit [Syntrophus sp. PtaU1.Bin208]